METICRLCAKEKPLKQLVNSIEDQTLNIQQKLIDCCRWNSIITTEYDALPKKICNPCYRNLEMSWSFAESVSQAQNQIFSMFADEKPIVTSTEHADDIYDTVVKDEPLEINDVHLPETVEPIGELEVVLKQENPSDGDDVTSENFRQDISDVGISNDRPKRKTKSALEKHQAEIDKDLSKPMHKKSKTINSKTKDKGNSKPVQKQNQPKKVEQLEIPSLKRCVCNTCGKVVTGVYRFKLHLKTHLKPQKPHECQTCGKRFRQKDKLKQHENIHTGAKPHGCDFCDYRTGHYSNYLKHLRQKHGMARKTEHLFKPAEGGLTFGKYVTFYEVNTDY